MLDLVFGVIVIGWDIIMFGCYVVGEFWVEGCIVMCIVLCCNG